MADLLPSADLEEPNNKKLLMNTRLMIRRQARPRRRGRRIAGKAGHAEGHRAAMRELLGYPVQAKLKVGAPDDAHEREADAVADRVMAMPEGAEQRPCPACEEEEGRKAGPDSDNGVVRRKEGGGEAAVTGADAATIGARRGGGRPLPTAERAFFEPRMGIDLGRVRIHADDEASRLATRLSARAFTVGGEVYFGHGEYRPGTGEGRRLLAHELAHVAQQRRRTGQWIQRAACPATSCAGYSNSRCSAYSANHWWLPRAYVNNATLACRETPNHPTAKCVRKTLQDLLAATPTRVKGIAASMKPFETFNPALYAGFVVSSLTPRIYRDHVTAYRTAGCPKGPAAYPAWIAVSTIPMPPGTVGLSIRYGGGSCSGKRGSWCDGD